VVLGDRSFLTTLATRWRRSKTIGERAHFDRCRALEWAIPIPDHVIYIDAPISEIRRRVELRRRRYGVRDECVKRLQDAQNAYAAIRQSSLPELAAITWHLVSNDGLPERVAVAVLRIVLTILIHEKSRNEATALS
jgi:thymidylate kinase